MDSKFLVEFFYLLKYIFVKPFLITPVSESLVGLFLLPVFIFPLLVMPRVSVSWGCCNELLQTSGEVPKTNSILLFHSPGGQRFKIKVDTG